MKVAAAQISCSLGDPKAICSRFGIFLARARDAGVELIVFPEMTDTGYSMSVIEANANSWSSGFGSRTSGNRGEAFHCDCLRRIGTGWHFNLQFPGFCRSTGPNRCKISKGPLVCSRAREEQKRFASGDAFASFALGELRFGFSICYDLRFPEMYRKLVVEEERRRFYCLFRLAVPTP